MRLNSPEINLIIKACTKASRSLIRDFGEIENLQVSCEIAEPEFSACRNG